MKKILSTISVVFCVISAKSQLNFIQDFENIQTVLQQFGVVNLVKSDQYEICNVTSLAIRESGYGSLISKKTLNFLQEKMFIYHSNTDSKINSNFTR